MGELFPLDDVDWRAVQEAHDTWKEEQGGFGGPGVQLLSLVVAVALAATGIGSAFATMLTGINTATGAAAVKPSATTGAAAGAAGIRIQAEAAGSKNTSRAQIHTNSAVAAGGTLSVTSGADTTVAGANLEGKSVAMDVGGDLVVKSEQDKRAAAGSNWNAGGSVTFGYGFSAEAHVGMGKNSASSAWVNRQTSVIGQEGVDIRTEKNTHVEGAVIAVENGNLRLDTGTLTFKDIKDRDTSKGFQASLSGSYSSGGDSTGPTLDGSYGSSDRRQINRATIGEGEIIIRSDPAKGLEGLNRDLRRAREITRDDQTSVVVYVDSAAIQEIVSGFEGIRGNLTALGELVNKVFPDDARLRDSVANQLSLKEKLIESGKLAEEAEALVQKYALYADLLGEIGKLVDAKGSWDNLTDAAAQEFLGSLMMDTRFVTLVASTDDSLSDSMGIVIGSGKFVLGAVVGGLEAAGSDAKSALFFLNDMSGYMLNKVSGVSGGYLYQQEARNFTNTVNDFVNGIGYLVQHADEVGPAIVAGLEKKWNDYLAAFEAEEYYEAGRLYGEFYYQISMLLIAGEGVAKTVLGGLKSVAPKFATAVETAEAARVAKVGAGAIDVVQSSKSVAFAEGAGKSAFTANRLQHASRHLIDAGVFPNWSTATGQKFIEVGSRILESPTATFDHVLRGGLPVKGFMGSINGKYVAIMVYKEGPLQGQIATAVVPSSVQLANWGVKP
jgi:filamentous hemagglutinin